MTFTIYDWRIINKNSRAEYFSETKSDVLFWSYVRCLLYPAALSLLDRFTAEDQLSSPTKDNKRLLSKSTLSNCCPPLGSPSVSARSPLCDMDCFQVTGGENGHLIIFNGCLKWSPLQWCAVI